MISVADKISGDMNKNPIGVAVKIPLKPQNFCITITVIPHNKYPSIRKHTPLAK